MRTTLRDDNECKTTVMDGKKVLRQVCGRVLARKAWLPPNGLKSSCGSEGPVEVKVGAG